MWQFLFAYFGLSYANESANSWTWFHVLPSLVNPVLQSGSSRQTSNPFRCISGRNGSLGSVRWGVAGLCCAASGRGASFSKLCQPVPGFLGNGRVLPLTDERWGNLRHANKQIARISYTTFATKSSITWNYNVGKQGGYLGHCFYLVLHKEFICSEIILNFHLQEDDL